MRKIFVVPALVIATVSIAGCGDDKNLKQALEKTQSTSTAVCASDTPDAKAQGDFVDALLNYQLEWEKSGRGFVNYKSDYASPSKTAANLGMKCKAASTLVSGLQLEDRPSDKK